MTANRIIDKAGIVLLQAADLIEQRGWWDGKDLSQRNNKLCALMAILRVCVQEPGPTNDMAAQWRLKCHVGCIDIADWNDASDAATVVKTMRAAAIAT